MAAEAIDSGRAAGGARSAREDLAGRSGSRHDDGGADLLAAIVAGTRGSSRSAESRLSEDMLERQAAARSPNGTGFLKALQLGFAQPALADLHDPLRAGEIAARRSGAVEDHETDRSILEVFTSVSSTAAARPLSIASRAIAMPSGIVTARPAISSEAPALSSTMSRAGPGSPSSTARAIVHFPRHLHPSAPMVKPCRDRRQPDGDRRCSRHHPGTPTLSCIQSSRFRPGHRRVHDPRADGPELRRDRATSSVSSGRATPTS